MQPERHAEIVGQTFPHADGLEVEVSAIDVTSAKPDEDLLVVSVNISLEVKHLPPGAGDDYPYTEGEKDTEKMTFLYSPSRDMWGEMDYSVAHALRGLVTRTTGGWELKRKPSFVTMQHAKIRVDRIVATKSVTKQNGGIQHRFAFEVTPLEIFGEGAGYRHNEGWIDFEKGKSVVIPFAFSEKPAPSGAR